MAFDKQEIKQLQFLFKENIDTTRKLILENEKRTEKNTKRLIFESEKRAESKTKLLVCEALEELVLPRLQAVEDKQEEHTETLQDQSDSLERIENIQRVEVKRNDAQDEKLEIYDQRIFKVEKVLVGK